MTKEEAIEVLNTYDMSEDNDDTEFKSAIALAIEELEQEPKTDWIVPIILIDKKGEEHDGLMDMRRMLIYLHNIPAETAMSLGYTWKSTEGSDKE